MFASPAIRIYSQENTEVAPRKPGATTNRKALFDRTVNAATPKVNSTKKATSKKRNPIPVEEDDDLFNYDYYTDKNNNVYKDLPVTPLTKKQSLNILRAYTGYGRKTPPFEYTPNLDLFIEMPEFKFEDLEPLRHPMELEVEDVEVPKLDFLGNI